MRLLEFIFRTVLYESDSWSSRKVGIGVVTNITRLCCVPLDIIHQGRCFESGPYVRYFWQSLLSRAIILPGIRQLTRAYLRPLYMIVSAVVQVFHLVFDNSYHM
jgi:hypothetical protein